MTGRICRPFGAGGVFGETWLPRVAVAAATSTRGYDLAPLRGWWERSGHDLTGNTIGRCPECGMAIQEGAETQGLKHPGNQRAPSGR
jgi:hypothetical protein